MQYVLTGDIGIAGNRLIVSKRKPFTVGCRIESEKHVPLGIEYGDDIAGIGEVHIAGGSNRHLGITEITGGHATPKEHIHATGRYHSSGREGMSGFVGSQIIFIEEGEATQIDILVGVVHKFDELVVSGTARTVAIGITGASARGVEEDFVDDESFTHIYGSVEIGSVVLDAGGVGKVHIGVHVQGVGSVDIGIAGWNGEMVNAVGRFLSGLWHEYNHLNQMEEIIAQATGKTYLGSAVPSDPSSV